MSTETIDYLLDELYALGVVSTKRMFGGHGLFLNGLMFSIVVDDVVYFKGDEQSARIYAYTGCQRFTYMRKDKPVHLNYYQAPDGSLDDSIELHHWATIAVASSERENTKKREKNLENRYKSCSQNNQ
jgi:DNA transformation protein